MNFTKVFIPRQAPCCKTSRPAGWGSAKGARSARSAPETTGQPADHFRSQLEVRPASSLFSYTRENFQESLKPKHNVRFKRRAEQKEPSGSTVFRAHSFLILLFQTGENGSAGASSGIAQPSNESSKNTESSTGKPRCSQRCRSSPGTQATGGLELQITGWQQMEERTNQEGLSHPRAPEEGRAWPFFISAHRCPGEYGDDL